LARRERREWPPIDGREIKRFHIPRLIHHRGHAERPPAAPIRDRLGGPRRPRRHLDLPAKLGLLARILAPPPRLPTHDPPEEHEPAQAHPTDEQPADAEANDLGVIAHAGTH
jgi:hypothetical protein